MSNYIDKKPNSNSKKKNNYNDIYINYITTIRNANSFKNIKNHKKNLNIDNHNKNNYNKTNSMNNRAKLKTNFGSFESLNSFNYNTIDEVKNENIIR